MDTAHWGSPIFSRSLIIHTCGTESKVFLFGKGGVVRARQRLEVFVDESAGNTTSLAILQYRGNDREEKGNQNFWNDYWRRLGPRLVSYPLGDQ